MSDGEFERKVKFGTKLTKKAHENFFAVLTEIGIHKNILAD